MTRVAALVILALVAGCSSMRPAKQESPKGDPVALGLVAEIALQRGDCKTASETYAKAAEASSDPALAKKATLVSRECGHLPAAWQSVGRWHALAPNSAEADARYAEVAVKLYHLPEAKAAIKDFSQAPPPKAKVPGDEQADVGAPGTADKSAGEVDEKSLLRGLTALTALLLEESDAPTVLAAMSTTLESTSSPEATSLLGELALNAY